MRSTVIEDERIRIPVGQLICLPAELVIQYEVVVRPFQTVSESCGESVYLELLVIVENIPQ